MGRKRITEIFPWLLPIRQWQRKHWFYIGMKRDGNCYANEKQDSRLSAEVFSIKEPLYNTETGFDMIYQENKVFNLKLAAKMLDGILIQPGETFSFWNLIRYADRQTAYKAGLAVVNGELTTVSGGGMCQMSNLLFSLFLRSPLLITERHGHRKKEFSVPGSLLEGVDATVSEGWLDLKVTNASSETFQVKIDFDEKTIGGYLLSNARQENRYHIENGDLTFVRRGQRVMEEVDVIRKRIDIQTGCVLEQAVLYKNRCEIGYQLPKNIAIIEEGI